MVHLVKHIKRCAFACGLAATALLAGCGGGVDFEGPGFDRLGLTAKKDTGDAKVPERAPLLLPPDRVRLPEPQQQQTAAAPRENWPNDPDALARQQSSEDAKKRKDYEDNGNWSKKADIDEFDKLSDPMERKEVGLLDRMFDRKPRNAENIRPENN